MCELLDWNGRVNKTLLLLLRTFNRSLIGVSRTANRIAYINPFVCIYLFVINQRFHLLQKQKGLFARRKIISPVRLHGDPSNPMPVAIDVGQRVLVYNPSHGWTLAYFVTAQQTNNDKLQILVGPLACSLPSAPSLLDLSSLQLSSQVHIARSLSLPAGARGVERLARE